MGEIAGIISPSSAPQERVIDRMLPPSPCLDRQLFRSRNLSITTSHTDVYHESASKIWVCIDGTLSNEEELKEKWGRQEGACSPSALIAEGYQREKLAVIPQLQGEATILIFDGNQEELILIRDRIGKKPFYWCHKNGYFLFGNQLKGLMRTGMVSPRPAKDGLSSFLFFGFVPQDITPIQEINKLLPSYYMRFRLNGNKSIHNYWSYSSLFEKQACTHAQCLEAAQSTFSKRLASLPSLACTWEHTLESALTARLVGEASSRPKHLYVLEPSKQDPILQSYVKKYGFQLHPVPWNPQGLIQRLPQILWALEEPIHLIPLLPLDALSQAIASSPHTLISSVGVKQLLIDGTPETSAGETWSRTSLLNRIPYPCVHHLIIPLLRFFHPNWAYQLLKRYYKTPLHSETIRQRALFVEEEIEATTPILHNAFDGDVFLHKFHHLERIPQSEGELMYFDSKTLLPDQHLFLREKLYSQCALQWEAPWLDASLLSTFCQTPLSQRLSAGEKGESAIELWVQEALCPSSFSPPSYRIPWKELRHLTYPLIQGQLVSAGILDRSAVLSLLKQAKEHPRYQEQAIALLVLEVWYALFISSPLEPHAPELTLTEVMNLAPAP